MKEYTEPTKEELIELAKEQKRLSNGDKPLEYYFLLAHSTHKWIYGQMVNIEKSNGLKS
jgi:hypothetical protein